MKKALAIVIALGIAVGLWWTREARDPAPVAPVVSERPPARPRVHVPPVLASQVRPSLKATDVDPKRHEAQEELWRHLRKFASDAKLTDAQWEQFEHDLSELAATESAAMANGVRAGTFEGVQELNDALGDDLEARCATYMTKEQVAVLHRSYFAHSLISRVRQLHYIPVVTPEN